MFLSDNMQKFGNNTLDATITITKINGKKRVYFNYPKSAKSKGIISWNIDALFLQVWVLMPMLLFELAVPNINLFWSNLFSSLYYSSDPEFYYSGTFFLVNHVTFLFYNFAAWHGKFRTWAYFMPHMWAYFDGYGLEKLNKKKLILRNSDIKNIRMPVAKRFNSFKWEATGDWKQYSKLQITDDKIANELTKYPDNFLLVLNYKKAPKTGEFVLYTW